MSLYRLARHLLNRVYIMKNIIAIIASLVIIFAIFAVFVGNLVVLMFAIVPTFLFFVTQALKDFTSLNDAPKQENYTFVYNIAANDYIMVPNDVIGQYKNNPSFVIPE